MSEEDLEAAIARYRTELVEESDLGAVDLDELEDHLRALIDELRAAGLGAQTAFVEATRRLGEPHALARELAHTRPVFGARPSKARAWSALALQLAFAIPAWLTYATGGMPQWVLPFELINILMMVGLAYRTSWARAMTFGVAAFAVVGMAGIYATTEVSAWPVLARAVAGLGITAFLAPTRWRDFTAAGWALALAVTAVPGLTSAQAAFGAPLGDAVLAPYLFGMVGILLRARWATPALLAVFGVSMLAIPMQLAGASSNPTTAFNFGYYLLSILALVPAAFLARRGARGAGSLRAIAR